MSLEEFLGMDRRSQMVALSCLLDSDLIPPSLGKRAALKLIKMAGLKISEDELMMLDYMFLEGSEEMKKFLKGFEEYRRNRKAFDK